MSKRNPDCEVIEVGALALGMYVTELDRPWLGTPFFLQGFLIDEAEQIAQLWQFCRSVLIDTYCAITRQRVFSAAVSCQKALEMLSRMRGVKFREALVDQFVQCVGLYPIGTLLELNTGEVAVVIQQNHVRRLKPRVLVLLAQDKTLERSPRSFDLILDPATPTGEPYRIKHALASNAYGIDPTEFFLD